MSEINIGKKLQQIRHQRKITQEELAKYMGVSKAAVSKWESGISFPDITFLPQLATFCNISIDELMGYEPQMTKEQTKKTYHELKELFAAASWEEAYAVCREYERKYYSCLPFLLQIIILYMNHSGMAADPKEVLEHCTELAKRIRSMSEDVNDIKEAAHLEALCFLLAGEPMQAMDMMEQRVRPMLQDTELLAKIHYSLGNVEKSRETYQIAMYQHLLAFLSAMPNLLLMDAGDEKRTEDMIHRTLQTMDAFQIDRLHPNTAAVFYVTGAQVYMGQHREEQALALLERFVYVCNHCFFPLRLHGDDFFDAIDGWFQEFDLGQEALRSESLVRASMRQSLVENPAFAALREKAAFKQILKQLL